MFEKDVLQLIRGLRAHKGQEREYIQSSLRECRKEVKSQDMDVKAIALLKLVYLEMFGHDMSWASFHVLEVMSSQKFLQKRVGYLAAVQTFRPDTEVLMLAENLLKKDLGSTDKSTISLTLSTIPHVINPSMANSLLTDLLPRMSHSSPIIRKKTIVTLYRLAVVYPEILRPAWPKIKERLTDENEDPSVTAAIVNVVCELGWRRPHDFLPLAPRLFDLLTHGGNNWMGIKIIKLFSVLTPIEPRLVKKLLGPLTQLIKTTPAMSLLYECINGIIQGGIMEAAQGTSEGDDIARLCISKLRGMLVVQGDTNLRFVALLAFAKITSSHAALVAEHQDVILECIDDPDLSIRTRALDLVIGMVNADNIQHIADRLVKQLSVAGKASAADDPDNDRGAHAGVQPLADDDEGDQVSVKARAQQGEKPPTLPDSYRTLVIDRVLEMCTKDMYAILSDFEWYIEVLVSLVKQCPAVVGSDAVTGMATKIGEELLNVTVRVKAMRPEAVLAAQTILLHDLEGQDSTWSEGATGVLSSVAFIAGEYARLLPAAESVLTALLHPRNAQLPAKTVAVYVQAIPKVFVALTADENQAWTSSRSTQISLLVARIVHFLEPLTLHPALEVQERAVEYLELFRLINEASTNHTPADDTRASPPLLLTQAIPALFAGAELNPVAVTAIARVPLPDGLDLDAPINSALQTILQQAEYDADEQTIDEHGIYRRYHERQPTNHDDRQFSKPAAEMLEETVATSSYQESPVASETAKQSRLQRHKDDPYYIDSGRNSGTSTPLGSILHSTAGSDDFDVDNIPVVKLDLGDTRAAKPGSEPSAPRKKDARPRKQRHFEIAADETLPSDLDSSATILHHSVVEKPKRSLLEVDSSGLATMSLEAGTRPLDVEQQAKEEEEMARAIREVERLRLAMQRKTEEIKESAEDVVVTSRRRKARTGVLQQTEDDVNAATTVKKKKKKKPAVEQDGVQEELSEKPRPKQKKKRVVAFAEPPG